MIAGIWTEIQTQHLSLPLYQSARYSNVSFQFLCSVHVKEHEGHFAGSKVQQNSQIRLVSETTPILIQYALCFPDRDSHCLRTGAINLCILFECPVAS
jgi:hypothetical protein